MGCRQEISSSGVIRYRSASPVLKSVPVSESVSTETHAKLTPTPSLNCGVLDTGENEKLGASHTPHSLSMKSSSKLTLVAPPTMVNSGSAACAVPMNALIDRRNVNNAAANRLDMGLPFRLQD